LLALIICRAFPKVVPRIKDLKKLFGGLSKNFWCGVEEDKHLRASALGSAVVTVEKKFVDAAGAR
jgi:hypothetical protein